MEYRGTASASRDRRPCVPANDTQGAIAASPRVSSRSRFLPRLAWHRGPRSRGQSLVEFAISVPVVLLMLLFGIDFGRVFLGWVTLNNTVREAANYAALYPTAWGSPATAASHPEYVRLIGSESSGINCTMPSTLPAPSFPNGTDIGSPAVVAITCRFSLITPLMSGILGSPINVSSSASFPIRSGVIAGVPVGSSLPQGTPSPTGTPSPSVDPSVAPSPTPVPNCIVPNLVSTNTSQATRTWTDAGFTATNLQFSPLVPPNGNITSQNLQSGSSQPCNSTMTVVH
jgi:hypothetical protein